MVVYNKNTVPQNIKMKSRQPFFMSRLVGNKCKNYLKSAMFCKHSES